nr:hypothetical protein [Tanacetum cinerariifolium]
MPVDSSQGTGKWFGHGAPDVMNWIGFGLGPRECSIHGFAATLHIGRVPKIATSWYIPHLQKESFGYTAKM